MNKAEIMKALASAAKEVGATPGVRSAFAQVITESIEPNHLSFDILSSFMPTRTLNPGDQLSRRVRKGVPVRTFVPGTNHLADQIAVRDVMVHAIDQIVAKVRYSLWEIQRGELGTMDTFRQDMQNAMIDEIVGRAFTLLSTVWTSFNGGSNYTNATSTGLTKANLTDAMEVVLRRAGSIKAVVGARAALLPLYEDMGIVTHTISSTTTVIGLQNILEQWTRSGRISEFKGAPLVELPQIYKRDLNGYDTALIPEDKVIVVGDNAGEFVLYGGVESWEHVDTSIEPPDYSLAMMRGFGIIVDRPENIAVIKVA
jgi:hypothetical protein